MTELERTTPERLDFHNANKFKLGLFAANCAGGRAATKVPERWKATWDDNLQMAKMADDAGIDFILPIGRWRGYRGESNFHGSVLEPTVTAAGMLAQTKRITVFSTVHAPLHHPVVAAKQLATADLIGHGRMGLNVVCGWNQDEFDMFGVEKKEHSKRYAYGKEWLEVVRLLWKNEKEFDYDGELIKLKGLISNPKPYGGSRPMVMNAGTSPTGRDFALTHADALFVLLVNPEQGIKTVADACQRATEVGRDGIRIFTTCYYVCRPTRKEAEDYHHYYADEMGDLETYEHLLELAFTPEQARKAHSSEELRRRQIAGNGGYPVIGSPDDVAAEIKRIYDMGFSGLAGGFVNYNNEFPYFRDEVLPRLERYGIREKTVTMAAE